MRLKRHPSGYIYAYPVNKKPFSLRTKDMAEAERTAKELKLDEMEQAQRIGMLSASAVASLRGARKVSVESAIADYLRALEANTYSRSSVTSSRFLLVRWGNKMRVLNMQIGAIERRHIDPFINSKDDTMYATRVRNFSVIRAFFRHCMAKQWIIENPAAGIAVRREGLKQSQLVPRETLPFTDEEIGKIIAKFEPGTVMHFAITCSLHTGLRLSDILKLEWRNIVGDRIVVSTSKTMALVEHKMTPELREALSHINRDHPVYLFPREAAALNERTWGVSAMSHRFRRACMNLGIEGKHFHGLRHTYAVRKKQEEKKAIFMEMLEQLSNKAVQEGLGHKSPLTTKIYLDHGKQQ